MDIRSIYDINSYRVTNLTKFDKDKVGSGLYGETGYDEIQKMINHFKSYFNNETVFYDLGSGLGKIVLHIGLECNPKKSCGIEYSKERHEKAIEIMKTHNIQNENISFINKSILECDISDATFIYIDNTDFSDNVNSEIYKIIPKGCLVVSRKRFKDSIKNNERIENDFQIETLYKTKLTFCFLKQ